MEKKKYPKIIALIEFVSQIIVKHSPVERKKFVLRVRYLFSAYLLSTMPELVFVSFYLFVVFLLLLLALSLSLSRACIDRPQRVFACHTYNCISFINFIFFVRTYFLPQQRNDCNTSSATAKTTRQEKKTQIYKLRIAENARERMNGFAP